MLDVLITLAVLTQAAELPALEVRGRDIDPGAAQATTELSAAELEAIRPTHPAEVFSRLPGTWVTRGSGQEHLSAVRSPLLAGAGGCGALLVLEDGVPVRPPGFCNVNGFFEINLLQAAGISVLRGPGGIGHASGGLHGVVDVRTRSPLLAPINRALVEIGSDDYQRLDLALTTEVGEGVLGLDVNLVDAGSFRVDEGYEHQFLTLNHVQPTARGQWRTTLASARLDQDTAGFIVGENVYRDAAGRQANLNPEAFRTGTALRLHSRGDWLDGEGRESRLSFFARRSRMTFLQHFLPGQPLERNGQLSLGAQFDRQVPGAGMDLDWGLDAELFRGFLFQEQDGPASGPPPVAGIRPPGRHYDFEVDGQRLGGYLAGTWRLADAWELRLGAHLDWIRYDYETALPPGNRAEDGSECGFGGCLYTRPADRSDDFFNLAPELTLARSFDQAQAWLRLARGFRAPQATELYRLQSGQSVADLDSEVMDAIELGLRGGGRVAWELVAFAQRKDNFIFRDAEGFNVSDGKTDHRGLEAALRYRLTPELTIAGRGSYAIHRYRFDRQLGGETIINGRDVSSAPRRLYSADLTWRPQDRWLAQLAFESTGSYWLDAANTRSYGGHRLWHAHVEYQLPAGWQTAVRARNLLDRRYAERADFAFGNYRYFPGPGRSLFVQLGRAW
ncbi:MAG: TonB-dependent receptor [Wenzhouxiangella sp.]|nr:MAG: TonB-dependent receptor [Wenzhouxiangella sp.]